MKTIYEGAKETAKRIRAILKADFAGQKFSVRSDVNSVRVSWVDGPMRDAVESKISHLQSCHFDGMTDSEIRVRVPGIDENGEAVDICGAKYIFCDREMSAELKARLVEKMGAYYGATFIAKIPVYDIYRYLLEAEKGYKD